VATLSGLAPMPITYTVSQLGGLTIVTGTAANVLNVLFTVANPLPGNGLNYVSGGGPNTLNLSGNAVPVNSESYSANGPGAGALSFDTIPLINFSGLQPINDVVPAGSFTFNAQSGTAQSVDFSNGPVFGGFQTATISDGTGSVPPLFELANIANKGSVTLNVGQGGNLDEQVNINNTVAVPGLTAMTVNTGTGNDLVNVTNTLVSTTVNTASGNDVLNARAAGLPAGTTLTYNGGPGGDTLNVDATGKTAVNTAVPGTIAFTPVGGTIADSFVENVNVTNVTDQALTPLPSTVNGIVGVAVTNVVAGQFTDADPNAKAGDFVASINWGDGSPTTPGVIVSNGPGAFAVVGSHTYGSSNTFPITVTVTDKGSKGSVTANGVTTTTSDIGGATTSIASTANVLPPTSGGVAINPALAIANAVEGAPLTSVPVATFTSSSPTATISTFSALINWGNGSPMSAGSVTQPGGIGTAFNVVGSHTYADSLVNGGSGAFTVTVHVTDKQGASVSVNNVVNVADVPINLGGFLDPASDSGASNTDGITNVNHPSFFGFSEPGSTIRLFATAAGGSPTLIAQGTTDASGYWTASSFVTLADGSYTVAADALDKTGHTTATAAVRTVTGASTFVIDTVGPKVTSVRFDRLGGQILVTFQDDRSGMDLTTVRDASTYQLSKNRQTFPGTYIVTALIPQSGASPTAPVVVPVVINNGKPLRGGKYVFTVRSGGVRDVAGNALDGEFYGVFSSGNNVPGGDFVARLDAIHRLITARPDGCRPRQPRHPAGHEAVPGSHHRPGQPTVAGPRQRRQLPQRPREDQGPRRGAEPRQRAQAPPPLSGNGTLFNPHGPVLEPSGRGRASL
jgi:hypothetical protein